MHLVNKVFFGQGGINMIKHFEAGMPQEQGDSSKENKQEHGSSRHFDVSLSTKRLEIEKQGASTSKGRLGRSNEIEQGDYVAQGNQLHFHLEHFINTEADIQLLHQNLTNVIEGYARTIEKLHKGGARLQDITNSNGNTEVIKTNLEKIAAENDKIINRQKILQLRGSSYLYDTDLNRLRGESITYAVNHAVNYEADNQKIRELDALTDLTVYQIAKDRRRALMIQDHQLPDIWRRVNEIYKRQYLYRENTEDAKRLMKYTERYRELEFSSLPIKKAFKSNSSFKTEIRTFLRKNGKNLFSLLSRYCSGTRSIKDRASIAVEQAGARLSKIEMDGARLINEKARFSKSQNAQIVKIGQDQEINISGRRGKQQRILRKKYHDIQEYNSKFADLEKKVMKEIFTYEKFSKDALSSCFEFIQGSKYQTPEKKMKLALLVKILDSYLNRMQHVATLDTFLLEVGKSKIEIQRDLQEYKERLENTIKKYGNGPWRSWLNDISSDGGFGVTLVELGLSLAKVSL